MTREEIRDALHSTQFALSAAFVQEVARALLAHQTAGQAEVDEATARGFTWAVGEVGKGQHVALLGALLDGRTDDALRLYDGIIAQAKLKGEEDHWLRRLGPLFEPAAPRIAINVYQRLLQVSPGDLFAQRRLAAVLTRAGDYDAADAAYHTLLARRDLADQVQAEASEGLAAIAAAHRGPAGQAKKPNQDAADPSAELTHDEVAMFAKAIQKKLKQRRNDPDVQKKQLAEAERAGAQAEMARALGHLGDIYRERGEFDVAEPYSRRALALFEELDDQAGIAELLNDLGEIIQSRGDNNAAIGYFGRARVIFEQIQNKFGVARSVGLLGTVALTHGDYPTAERHLNRTVALYQELGVPAGVAAATYNLALIAIARNDMADARVKLEQSLAVFQGEGVAHLKEVDLIRKTLAKIQGR